MKIKFHKRFEVLFYNKIGKLYCVAEYKSLQDLRDYLEEYPLEDGVTYKVIDHLSKFYYREERA